MKSRFILGLGLVLCGNCGAAIIYPKAPDGGRDTVATNVAPGLQYDAGFFHGLKMRDLTVAKPYREYYVVDLRHLVAGNLLRGTETHSWRYLLMHGTNAVGAATLTDAPQGALKYNDVQRPFFPNAPLDALCAAEKLPQIKKQDYEVRSLGIASLNFMAVWLHGQSDDIIIPLPPTFGRFNENQAYSESQVIKVLRKDAQDVIKHPNLLR
jgi:hypothetical protein